MLRAALVCVPRGGEADLLLFYHSGVVRSVVKDSQNTLFKCEFYDAYEVLSLEVLNSCHMLS